MVHVVAATHAHRTTSSSSTLISEVIILSTMVKAIAVIATVGTFLNLLLFEFDLLNFTVFLFDFIFEFFFDFLCFFQLLFYHEAVVRLHDLLVDELAPSASIQLIIEVEFVAVCRIATKALPEAEPSVELILGQTYSLLHCVLVIFDFLLDICLKGTPAFAIVDDLHIIIEAGLVHISLEAHSKLPHHVDLVLDIFIHRFFLFHCRACARRCS